MRHHCAPTSFTPGDPLPSLTSDAPDTPPTETAQRSASSAARTAHPGIRLAPDEVFPTALAELELRDLQVLHSRICCQLEQEYLTTAEGPHPVTLDRRNDLVAELSTRQAFLSPHPGP